MTTFSSVNAVSNSDLPSPAISTSAKVESPATDFQSAASPFSSTIVTVPSAIEDVDLPTYTSAGTLSGAASTATRATDSSDPVSLQMENDHTALTTAGRFSALGSALLDRFSTTGSDFSQTVSVASTSGVATLGAQLSDSKPDSKIGLTIKTASGVTVTIALTGENGGLAVSIKSSGKLSDSERAGIAKLASGFQQAIDGLSDQPPTVNLTGLTQFDTSVLSSVNFQYSITGAGDADISASYAQDSASRSLSVTDASGTMNVKLDTSNPALLGTDAERTQSVAQYLQQFDDANTRGHSDASLTSMFKDGFVQLNGVYGTSSPQTLTGAENTTWLQQSDHAMLSGLSDFSASIDDTSTFPDPMQRDQADSFSYDVSQTTKLDSSASADTLSQHQHSDLQASYHQALPGAGKLDLTSSMSSQSYEFVLVNDTADSTVQIASKNGEFVGATLSQGSDDKTRVLQYESGELVSDIPTPKQTSSSKDLLSLLEPLIKRGDAKHDTAEWQQALSQIHGMVLLGADN